MALTKGVRFTERTFLTPMKHYDLQSQKSVANGCINYPILGFVEG